jgi:hypothetical protein
LHKSIRSRGNNSVIVKVLRFSRHPLRADLELNRLVLCRFEGSETIANAAFQALDDRYGGRPLAKYALAPQEIDLN